MPRPLIIVSSRTGNTRVLAHAAADALAADLVSCDAAPDDLSDYNPIVLAFWCDKGKAPEDMIRVAKRIEDKDIGCIATMGADPTTESSRRWLVETAALLAGDTNRLKMTFASRGRIDQAVFDRMTQLLGGVVSPEREAGRLASHTHPDREDVEQVVHLVKSVFTPKVD